MKHFDQVLEAYKEAKLNLEKALEEGQTVELCEMLDAEGDYTEAFYELPAEFVTTKYGYAINYYLYKVTKENGKIYITGKDAEEDADYYFQLGDINFGTAAYVVDLVLDILNLN